MTYRFFIDDLQLAEEPSGWADISLELRRDSDSHGMMYTASTSTLVFYGPGAVYLQQMDDEMGVKANAVFIGEARCDDTEEWEEVLRGKLNFGAIKSTCGTTCSVSIPVEEVSCKMLFTNKLDQDVDMDSDTGLDTITALDTYPRMGFPLNFPAKQIAIGAKGSVAAEGDQYGFGAFPVQGAVTYFVRPNYTVVENESINTTQLQPAIQGSSTNGLGDSVVSPVVLNEEPSNCFSSPITYSFRMKGIHHLVGEGLSASIDLYKGSLANSDTFPGLLTKIDTAPIGVGPSDPAEFNIPFVGTTTLAPGEGIWQLFVVKSGTVQTDLSYITFDQETMVDISGVKLCPPTSSKVYALHESLSHIVESITSGCLRVRSDYYGRINSRPYAANEDGCGSMRVVYNGLQLRNGKQSDGSDAQFFLSFKKAMAGLQPIDNIGYGLESDPLRPGFDLVRVEPVQYFYQNKEILRLPFCRLVEKTTDESAHYSTINVGYNKWQVESVNSLDEVNATRQFRTSIDSTSNTLNIISNFIAGSFATEVTRQQNFAETGGADTTYDNETFITCVKRTDAGWVVDQGGITDPANVYSPNTLYNWKIRPIYNLMRWFKSICSCYTNITDTANRLFFSSGTGNYQAEGLQTDETCRIEKDVMAEDQDVRPNDFNDIQDAQPLWRPKPLSFSYALSKEDFDKLRANPYGFISVQCGTGDYIAGYIDSIKYSITKGTANFILRQKWSQ